MDCIHVAASTEYDILIEKGILGRIGEYFEALGKVRKVVVVSDSNVYPLYGEKVKTALETAGFETESFVFPAGEASKSMQTYEELQEFLCEEHLTRSDALCALGGGVVGDLTGFAAATYQRGIRYIQVPTTLLAAVDSSVGGKTAIDLKAGKNQVGCFYQPSAVICDTETLKTLPESECKCGLAEVIKYGVLGNRAFFEELANGSAYDFIEHAIKVCVTMKRDIVNRDEFDRGERMLLNFGHTFGHAAEKCSNFKLLHGQGVAMGMAVMARAAYAKGYCDASVPEKIVKILEKYGLPTEMPYSLEELSKATLADKKMAGKEINLIVPKEIGNCIIEKITANEVCDWLQNGGIG